MQSHRPFALQVPPRSPRQIARPHLEARLQESFEHKLTLISAPAGFGKSDLLAGFAARLDRPLAWLSLSAGDRDPVSFFSFLLAALETIQPGAGERLRASLRAAPPLPFESLLAALIEDLTDMPEPFVLVLDDLHLAGDERIENALAALLEQALPHLHLVVSTRVDPPWPLARLRAHGELLEVRAADLRFRLEETEHFLNHSMGLQLTPAQVAALHGRTEGWIAGLQLAAVALQSPASVDTDAFIAGFTGSHRYIMDYLTDEVLRLQPDWIENFLLHTSILERLNAGLGDALRAPDEGPPGASSQEVLEMLERLNLFLLPLDSERRWYRYHQLFADLLRHRLAQREPDRLPDLHSRASAWFQQEAEVTGSSRSIESALQHALDARDLDLLGEQLDRFGETLWQRGEYFRLRHWIELLPGEQLAAHPNLGILSAWILFASGQLPRAAEALAEVERNLDTHTQPAGLHGKAATVRAHLGIFSGNIGVVVPSAREALELLPAAEAAWRTSAATALGDALSLAGDLPAARQAYREAVDSSRSEQHPYLALNAGVKLAMTLRQSGMLSQSVELADQMLALAERSGLAKSALAGALLACKGETLCELSCSPEARRLAEQGVQYCESGGHIGLYGWSTLALLRVLFSTGDLDGVERTLNHFHSHMTPSQTPPWIASPLLTMQALLWLARGELQLAAGWAEARGLQAGEEKIGGREYEYLVFAEYLLAAGRGSEAESVLERVRQAAQASGKIAIQLQALLAQARLAWQNEDPVQARQALHQALRLGAPGGFMQIFIDAGPPLRPLLEDQETRQSFPEFSRRLLAALPAGPASQPGEELIDPLTGREIEVLELIAAGQRNADIARQLVISENTVLFHTKNIFSKLGVNNRTQAIARARQLALI